MNATSNTSDSQIESAPTSGEMSETDFLLLMDRLDEMASRRPYSPKSREAARLILVNGLSQKEAAARVGSQQQAINQLMNRIRHRMAAMPADWVQFKSWFPVEVAKQLEVLSKMLLKAKKSGKPLDITSFEITLP